MQERPIDPKKLRELLVQKAKYVTEACMTLGYSTSFMSKAFHMKELPTHAINNIEFVYGIKYEDYKPVSEEQEEMEMELLSTDEKLDKIHELLLEIRDRLDVKDGH